MACGREIFEGDFCKECKDSLPFNDKKICDHCGRAVKFAEDYCSTCKGTLVSLDKCRSVFNYQPPISTLIKKMKYDNCRYLADVFSSYLSSLYFKNYFNADYLTYVPMTEKARKKRGYNQSQLLAQSLSAKIGVPVAHCVVKTKETTRQAKLNRADRLKNLIDVFKINDKKLIKDKKVVIVDDVTTTGATSQAVAELLKKAGALQVYLITVASVPPFDKY